MNPVWYATVLAYVAIAFQGHPDPNVGMPYFMPNSTFVLCQSYDCGKNLTVGTTGFNLWFHIAEKTIAEMVSPQTFKYTQVRDGID